MGSTGDGHVSGQRGGILDTRPIADQIAEQLAPYLGPFNAKVAVKTFSKRTLEMAPEDVTLAHVPALLEALKPMLYTFVGRASTDALLERIRQGVA